MPREKLIQVRRGTEAEWTSVDPILELGEAGYETDTNKLKYGDGVSIWSLLPYITSGAGGGIVETIVAGTNVTVDDTDPANPIVSAVGGGVGTPTLQEVLDAGDNAQSPNNYNNFEFNLTEGGSTANVNLLTSVGGSGTQGSGLYFNENFFTIYTAPNDGSASANLDFDASDWSARLNGSGGVYINKKYDYDVGGSGDASSGRGYFFQGDYQTSGSGNTMSYGELDFSAIKLGTGTPSNQVYSFPNASGTVALEQEAQTATGDGTTTIDWELGNMFNFQFGAFNETFTFTDPTRAGTFILKLVQDSVGSRTATFPASVKWIDGTAPTLTTTATTGIDIITFYYDGKDYFAVQSLNFS